MPELLALVSKDVTTHICKHFDEMNTKLHIHDPLHVMNLMDCLDNSACIVGLFYGQTL